MPGPINTGLVDVLRGGDAHVEHPEGLLHDGTDDSADTESLNLLLQEDGFLAQLCT